MKGLKGVVWKFALPTRGHATISMPAKAQPLSAQAQDEQVTIWALVDADAAARPRDFYVVMTGEPVQFVNCEATFVGTVQLDGGRYVAHVFEVLR